MASAESDSKAAAAKPAPGNRRVRRPVTRRKRPTAAPKPDETAAKGETEKKPDAEGSETETPAGERRTRMIASFNRGYHGFQQTYRTCTPAANVAIKRYLTEGAKISRDLTARYAN